MLKVENLTVSAGKIKIIDDVSLSIESGEFVALVGKSGNGKTKLLEGIADILPEGVIKDSGKVILDGKELSEADIRRDIIFIFQNSVGSLDPVFTIGYQLRECLYDSKLKRKEKDSLIIDTLRRFNFDDPMLVMKQYPDQLSGGMCQRITIAMAVLRKCRVILMDEPTASLDMKTGKEIISLIKDVCKKEKITVLMTNHNQSIIGQYADRVISIKKGKLSEYEMGVDDAAYDKLKIKNNNENVLEFINVSKAFGKNQVLKNFSFSIKKGELVGLVGRSGVGKSTIANIIIGFESIDSGEIIKSDEIKKIQIVFQDNYDSLDPLFTVEQSIEEAMDVADRKKVLELLKEIDIDEKYTDYVPSKLSGGQRQRVCIARSLAAEPDFIIYDEVVSALDYETSMQILKLIHKEHEVRNITGLFISHDLDAVKLVCNRIISVQ